MSRGGYKMRTIDLGDGEMARVKVVERFGIEGHIVRWTDSCTGCCDLGEYCGLSHLYGYDEKAGCSVGSGCEECGHTGKRRRVEWVPFVENYEAYERALEAELAKKAMAS